MYKKHKMRINSSVCECWCMVYKLHKLHKIHNLHKIHIPHNLHKTNKMVNLHIKYIRWIKSADMHHVGRFDTLRRRCGCSSRL